MELKLLSSIYRRLIQEEWQGLPFGLRNGRIGLMTFMALYYEFTHNGKAHDLTGKILQNVQKERMAHNATLMNGNLGLAWTLDLFKKKGLIEHDTSLKNLQGTIFLDFMRNHYHSPISLTVEDGLFSAGIYTLMQLPDNDSYERYSMEERIISMIDECERQLNQSIKGFFCPEKLGLTALNSYMYFLKTCADKRIFPYKADLLLSRVHDLYCMLEEKPACDNFVYNYLKSPGRALIHPTNTNSQLLEVLGDIGFYSLLYGLPKMFLQALRQISMPQKDFLLLTIRTMVQNSLTNKTLYGLGYGLMLNTEIECQLRHDQA